MKVTVLALFRRSARPRAIALLALSAATGLLTAAAVPLLVWGVNVGTARPGFWAAAGSYLATLVGVWYLRRHVPTALAGLIETELAALRQRLVDHIRAARLRTLECEPALMEAFTRDLETLAHLPRIVEGVVISGVMLVGVTGYLAVLSPLALASWLLVCVVLAVVLRREVRVSMAAAEHFDEAWEDIDGLVQLMLDGLPQLKVHRRAARDINAELDTYLERLAREQHRRDVAQRDVEGVTDATVYLAFLLLLFALPAVTAMDPATAIALVAAVFMGEQALTGMVRQSQFIIASEVAWRGVCALLARLRSESAAIDEPPEPPAPFTSLALTGVEFSYGRDFAVGPVNLTVRRGDLVFIVGGNGSGKTTLMKLLCGLYEPQRGSILLNGQPVSVHGRDSYRQLFTAIFTHQHLFQRTYGLYLHDPEQITALLERFALGAVTRWLDGAFTNLTLSTGQAKRLAMVVALLEDRPIFVLDEWAAHQDPTLRRYFFDELLPDLQARGKTIVAVSHDERFFDRADRLMYLESGQIAPVPRSFHELSLPPPR